MSSPSRTDNPYRDGRKFSSIGSVLRGSRTTFATPDGNIVQASELHTPQDPRPVKGWRCMRNGEVELLYERTEPQTRFQWPEPISPTTVLPGTSTLSAVTEDMSDFAVSSSSTASRKSRKARPQVPPEELRRSPRKPKAVNYRE